MPRARSSSRFRWFALTAAVGLSAVSFAEAPADRAVAIEAAHGAPALRAAGTVSADITIDFGGKRAIDGRIHFTADGGRSRIEMRSGTTVVFDGEKAWVSPASAEFPMARFHALTWPYFALAPFKLRDGGAHLADSGTLPLTGSPLPAMRLTFAPGTGDAPDDWYLVYTDPQTAQVQGLAYIVTYGKAKDAASEPHAVVYGDYVQVDGVTLATSMTFFNWEQDKGVVGEPIGVGRLSNIRLGGVEASAFTRPEDAREDALPGAK